MEFRNYQQNDYEALHRFLVALCKDDEEHRNWNWARLEWMMWHPGFEAEHSGLIGLWIDKGQVVAAAIYDMSFGEAFCATLPGYESIKKEVLDYAYQEFQDKDGLKIAVSDDSRKEVEALKAAGYSSTKHGETLLRLDLGKSLSKKAPKGISLIEFNPYENLEEFQWLLWQGFDHGSDRKEFEQNCEKTAQKRPNFNEILNIAAKNETGELVAFCGVWYLPETDYAYVEPVCVIPSYRGKGIGKAVVYEALRKAKSLGAKKAYVLSDNEFYLKLGFEKAKHFTFYHKKAKSLVANGLSYRMLRLLGKGKGGYSYLVERDGKRVVFKQIHHEPCSFYSFGNKIEAEQRDYQRLVDAGIRVPKLIDIDLEREVIVKELVNGKIIFDMVAADEPVDEYITQVREMAAQAKAVGLNIDFFPTNFIVQDGLLYYIDYECNPYMDEWSFERWAIRYWTKTPEFEGHYQERKRRGE